MKKTISYALIFSFVFALAAQLPALAEDNASDEPMLTSAIPTSVEATTTSVGIPDSFLRDGELKTSSSPIVEPRKPEPRENEVKATSANSAGKNLERIPSPDYVKYFEKIQKIGKDLFGVRKNEQEVNRLKIEATKKTQEMKIETEKKTQEMKMETEKKTQESKMEAAKNNLERISSPDKMSLFEKIQKIGKDLFGIKKTEVKNTSSTTEVKATNLEKITSLDQVKLFDQIKKIGNDLFGVRKKGLYALPTMTTDLIACTSAAIDAKDAKISAAFTTSATEIAATITARGTCQKAALALTSEVQKALNDCNKSFQDTHKAATEKVKTAQKEAWSTYTTGLKACATAANTSEIKLEDGGQNVSEVLQQ
jgi:hypothetical protein